jgi:hypothetical protein
VCLLTLGSAHGENLLSLGGLRFESHEEDTSGGCSWRCSNQKKLEKWCAFTEREVVRYEEAAVFPVLLISCVLL